MKLLELATISLMSLALHAMDNKKMFCNYTKAKGINVNLYTAVCISGVTPYYGTPNPACRHTQNPVYPKTLIPTTEHRFYCPKGQLPYISKK